MPPVRQAVLSWNPRDNGPAMVNLIEAWMPLLPVEIAENLMEQVFSFLFGSVFQKIILVYCAKNQRACGGMESNVGS